LRFILFIFIVVGGGAITSQFPGVFASTAYAAGFASYNSGAWNSPAVWGVDSAFGSIGTGDGQFESPTGITVDSNGNLYVAEENNYRIQKFNASGTFVSAWGWGVTDGASQYEVCTSNCRVGISGTGNGQFTSIFDIIATGTVVDVVDLYNDTVSRFSTSGAFLSKFVAGAGNYDDEGLAIDGNGNVYTQGISSNEIKVYNATGTFLSEWGWGVTDGANQYEICTSNCFQHYGGTGGGDGELHHPTHLTAYGNKLYVSDYLNYRIEEYNTSGTFVAVWGWGVQDGANQYEVCTSGCQSGIRGLGNGQFSVPEGIRTDSSGDVYVADATNNDIQEFDPNGNFIRRWGSKGTTPGQFNYGPLGLAVDSNNNIYVADVNGDYRIHKFDSNGNPILFSDCSLSSTCVAGTDYPGSSDSVTISSGTSITVPASASFSLTSLNISSGSTLSQGAGSTITLSGIWNDAGVYSAAPDAQVVLNGVDQYILGNTTFANLSKTVSSADILSFDANSTIAVSGQLSLQGVSGNLLSLSKTAPTPVFSSQFSFTPSDFPSAIAVDLAGNSYIADCGSNPAVYKFNASGTLMQTIGSSTLSCPYGVAVDPSGNVYTESSSNTGQYIEKYAPDGTEIAQWGASGIDSSSTIDNPVGILYDNGHIYAAACNGVSSSTTGVYVFDTSGNFVSQFGQGQLDCPYYITADSSHNIYVPDYTANTIFKYSPSGTFLSSFKVSDASVGAVGVAVDASGVIYATRNDSPDDDEIYIFSPTGSLITTFGSAGTGPGQFNFATGPLTFDSHGDLYSLDNDSDLRIQKFSFSSASTWGISAGSTAFSFLSVANSTAATKFTCTTGCVDDGGNTNWVFSISQPTPPASPSLSVSVPAKYAPPGWQIGDALPWVTSTSTPQMQVSTNTIAIVSPTSSSVSSTSSEVALLEAELQSLLAQSKTHGTSFSFARNLSLGMTGSDVKELQLFLIMQDSGSAAAKLAAHGTTKNFSTLTFNALIEFQRKAGIAPASGFFGPITRAWVNNMEE